MQPVNQPLADGVGFLALPDDRFKTARITAALLLPLREATASANAILPFLLRRSCAAYPDFTTLQRRLCELYGARVTGYVMRVGESQALLLNAVSIDDRFALDGEAVASQCAALLGEMLFRPAWENGVFRAQDLELERRCLTERIQSEINEKRLYARHRCEQVMCEGEPYAVGRYGTLRNAEELTAEQVTGAWRQALAGARIQVIAQGAGDLEAVAGTLREGLSGIQRQPLPAETAGEGPARRTVRTVTERMDVNQAKLVMGFRTGVTEPDGDVPAMRLMNALWGGTPHSLLFRHVREELSLCYYCASSYDRLKGVMLVDSGVEEANAARAQEEVLRQLEAIRAGRFEKEDLESARRSVINQLNTVGDLQTTLASWYLGQSILPRFTSPSEAAGAVESVTADRVMAAAARVTPDAVYLLAGKEEN